MSAVVPKTIGDSPAAAAGKGGKDVGFVSHDDNAGEPDEANATDPVHASALNASTADGVAPTTGAKIKQKVFKKKGRKKFDPDCLVKNTATATRFGEGVTFAFEIDRTNLVSETCVNKLFSKKFQNRTRFGSGIKFDFYSPNADVL